MTKRDARIPNRIKGATRHFDKVRAVALAWEGRGFALPPEAANKATYNIRENRADQEQRRRDTGL